jgi:hypothetical protein
MTFAKGASLKEDSGLFNAGLEGNTKRAINLRATRSVKALKAVIRPAVALNTASAAEPPRIKRRIDAQVG